MTVRRDIMIDMADGTEIAAWLYLPDGERPRPMITMSHGFAATRRHGLDAIAERMADAGFVVAVHDHRNFGDSGGTIQHDIDPFQQIEDWRRVIAHLSTLQAVDRSRIGIWGTSFSGGHALVLGATDSAVKAVFAQVPTTDGFASALRRVPPQLVDELESAFINDEIAQAGGAAPALQAVADLDLGVSAVYRTADAVEFYRQTFPAVTWENTVTVQSSRRSMHYVPADWISRISPKPLLMLIAEKDLITPTDLALAAFGRANEPKEYILVPGGHFDPYTSGLDVSTAAAIEFFGRTL